MSHSRYVVLDCRLLTLHRGSSPVRLFNCVFRPSKLNGNGLLGTCPRTKPTTPVRRAISTQQRWRTCIECEHQGIEEDGTGRALFIHTVTDTYLYFYIFEKTNNKSGTAQGFCIDIHLNRYLYQCLDTLFQLLVKQETRITCCGR